MTKRIKRSPGFPVLSSGYLCGEGFTTRQGPTVQRNGTKPSAGNRPVKREVKDTEGERDRSCRTLLLIVTSRTVSQTLRTKPRPPDRSLEDVSEGSVLSYKPNGEKRVPLVTLHRIERGRLGTVSCT